MQFSCYSQSNPLSNQPAVLKSKYDSAKLEFEKYEEKYGGFVQTKNVKLHYLEWGNPKDTSLIWVHGSFTNSYELLHVADDLVKIGYHIIAIDYYGHGLTKLPNHGVSLYHVADDINTLMEVKNIKNAIIGGWSRGGVIATAFYDAYPIKVLGLILEDGGSVSSNKHYHKMKEPDLRHLVKGIFKEKVSYPSFEGQYEAYQAFYDHERKGTQFELLAWLTQDSGGKWSIGVELDELFNMSNEEQFVNTILRPTQATLFGESMSIIEPKIIYRNLHVPMLILDPVSDNDMFPYEKENKDLKNDHPDLIVYRQYEDTGHNIHYERPKEFVQDLENFLMVVNDHWSSAHSSKK